MLFLMIMILYVVPVWALVYAIVGLCGYLAARRRAKHEPSPEAEALVQMKKRKMIVAFIVSGVLMGVFIGVMVLLVSAIAYM